MKKLLLLLIILCNPIVNVLGMEKDESSRLSKLIENNNVDAVRACLNEGTDPNMEIASNKCRLLNYAVFCEAKEMIGLLLDSNANPHLEDDLGWNALLRAAAQGTADIVELLLSRSEFSLAEIHEALDEASYGVDINTRLNRADPESASARSEEHDSYKRIVALLLVGSVERIIR